MSVTYKNRTIILMRSLSENGETSVGINYDLYDEKFYFVDSNGLFRDLAGATYSPSQIVEPGPEPECGTIESITLNSSDEEFYPTKTFTNGVEYTYSEVGQDWPTFLTFFASQTGYPISESWEGTPLDSVNIFIVDGSLTGKPLAFGKIGTAWYAYFFNDGGFDYTPYTYAETTNPCGVGTWTPGLDASYLANIETI